MYRKGPRGGKPTDGTGTVAKIALSSAPWAMLPDIMGGPISTVGHSAALRYAEKRMADLLPNKTILLMDDATKDRHDAIIAAGGTLVSDVHDEKTYSVPADKLDEIMALWGQGPLTGEKK